jgi:hypothetical protein
MADAYRAKNHHGRAEGAKTCIDRATPTRMRLEGKPPLAT